VLVFPGASGASVSGNAAPGASISGNVALDGLFGARIAWAGDVDAGGLAAVAADVVERLRDAGSRPALIPFGGSDATGARGYVLGGRELLAQAPDLRTVVVALGSGGTMAGLVAALGPEKVLGIDTGAREDPLAFVAALAGELGAAGAGPDRLRARFDLVGSGYADLVESTESALLLAARSEGIVLDPIYTGRAMAGLVAAVRDGDIKPGEKTVFLHTGGLPGLFGHAAAIDRAFRGLGTYPLAD
jgi:L-cysteate sulfo-lyase